jgi:uridine kinase
MQVAILGIAGGSASGKTTVVTKILEALAGEPISLVDMDSYYRDLGRLPLEDRQTYNFDHPDAIDNELLLSHIEKLRGGEAIEKPIYSFREHTRMAGTTRVEAGHVIIVEGILALATKELRERMDLKVFVEADDDIRFIRRLTRDVKERGRTIDAVVGQYIGTVRPMHLAFVEPSKRYADIVVPSMGPNDVAIGIIVAAIRHTLSAPIRKFGDLY